MIRPDDTVPATGANLGADEPDLTCSVCGNAAGNRPFTAREMMYGSREEFEYVECAACGCLRIAAVPADLARFYPADYYSLRADAPSRHRVRDALLAARASYQMGEPNPVGWLLARLTGNELLAWGRAARIRRGESVLDVGCGTGRMLLAMRSAGYRRLLGADPFIEGEIDYGGGLRILKRAVAEIEGEFDFVMMHHAFEHMPDPAGMLREVHRLLRPGGRALIRIPVADSHAWRTYGRNWVQLDAPRHLFVHTERSVRVLAEGAGLELERVMHDSNGLQFWGSEQYARDIPLHDARSAAVNQRASIFTRAELRRFAAEARELNRRGEGDQAGFYLRRPA